MVKKTSTAANKSNANLPNLDDKIIVADEPAIDQGEFKIVPLSDIRISKTNRKRFNEQKLTELAASIKEMGVAQPILIRPVTPTATEPQPYEIVAGERRFRASIIAGVVTIPAMCRKLTDLQAAKIQILENLQREDPHPLEEAEGYENLMLTHGYSADQLADELKKSRSYIYGRLKLCSLALDVREQFLDDKFSASTALLIARIPVPELQVKAVKEILTPLYDGDLMSYRAAAQHIQNRYTLDLDEAPFDIQDAKLLKIAGSCVKCPKRTGNQADVFTDIDPNICTDPDCFDKKKAALDLRKIDDANKRGIPFFEGEEATKLNNERLNFNRTSLHVDGDDQLWAFKRATSASNRNQTIENAIAPECMPKPECVIRLTTGKVKTFYSREAIQAALEKAGLCLTEAQNDAQHAAVISAPPSVEQLARQKEAEEDAKTAEDETEFRKALYKQIRLRGLSGLTIESQRALVNMALDTTLNNTMTDCKPLSDLYAFGCDRYSAINNHVAQASAEELQRVLMDFLVTDLLEVSVFDLSDLGDKDDHFTALLKIAEYENINTEDIRKAITQPAPEVVGDQPFKRPLLSLKKNPASPTDPWPFPTPAQTTETAGAA